METVLFDLKMIPSNLEMHFLHAIDISDIINGYVPTKKINSLEDQFSYNLWSNRWRVHLEIYNLI